MFSVQIAQAEAELAELIRRRGLLIQEIENLVGHNNEVIAAWEGEGKEAFLARSNAEVQSFREIVERMGQDIERLRRLIDDLREAERRAAEEAARAAEVARLAARNNNSATNVGRQ